MALNPLHQVEDLPSWAAVPDRLAHGQRGTLGVFGLLAPLRVFELMFCHPCFADQHLFRVLPSGVGSPDSGSTQLVYWHALTQQVRPLEPHQLRALLHSAALFVLDTTDPNHERLTHQQRRLLRQLGENVHGAQHFALDDLAPGAAEADDIEPYWDNLVELTTGLLRYYDPLLARSWQRLGWPLPPLAPGPSPPGPGAGPTAPGSPLPADPLDWAPIRPLFSAAADPAPPKRAS